MIERDPIINPVEAIMNKKLIRESSGFSSGRMDFRGSADGEVKCDNLLVGRGAS